MDGGHVKLPVIGWTRMRASVSFTGTSGLPSASHATDRWLGFIIEVAQVVPARGTQRWSVWTLAFRHGIPSDGSTIGRPGALRSNRKHLRRRSRAKPRR